MDWNGCYGGWLRGGGYQAVGIAGECSVVVVRTSEQGDAGL